MKKRYFSPSTRGFYLEEICGDSFPDDCILLSKDEYETLRDSRDQIGVDANGRPTIGIQEPLVLVLERAKNELRDLREPILSAVTGIGWDALASGDNELVKEAQGIRNALRDLTDDPALNAAQTYEEMRAAGVAAYRRIAAGASPAFAATFKEFTGA